MKTSTAEASGYKCLICKDEVTKDRSGKGFVRHMSISICPFERTERDAA